ncbi:4-diphosphocytidyl-2-C-methyl-D-erythritol kinase [Microtetraspora sp. NBRC 13810]|uniref:4-(cytidine 5'-diphospho)-2-C-methyl-D-erythritol kinase n=1 Tax=Microtetraspora sp. NBRC 13810 TaxID=3030990 RepID=UPI0024A17645|nr:4-(cytidine 5'-diphospho)-2-C-methyl-D-erythritol kinase [Microtetraspora sp. NBRC 13810]GLW07268.1 4-diphosphocytidyl-2-C-methyl-D-erythritol kinase [Microtetraspora sp. NBRC 13810]
MSSVTVRVPAKVNLHLAVGPLRDDGFHDLVNVFHAVSLYDEVTAVAAGGISVRVEGESADLVPLDGDNLAVRAARALAAHATAVRAPHTEGPHTEGPHADGSHDGGVSGVELTIRKAIPVAGGMAGGSADAAAALVACNELWGLGLSREELMEIGAELGSDVPFAVLGGTAVGTGRGERLTEVEAAGRFHWVFALADGGLSTATVYGECDRLRAASGEHTGPPQAGAALMDALRKGDAAALGAELANDLQPAALALKPALADTLRLGREHGALGALVSGSGPTCAFLTGSGAAAAELAGALRAAGVCREAVTAYGPVPGATVLAGAGKGAAR